MPQVLEKLLFVVEGDTRKMRAELVKAEGVAKRSGANMGRSFAGLDRRVRAAEAAMTGFRFSMAAAAGVAGVGAIVKAQISAADAIGKTADGIGISTDALQKYRVAAQLAGVETATIDGAFQAFGKRLGELKVGTGTLTTFLDKFDAVLKEQIMRAPSTEAALQLIFRAMADIEDQSVKAAFAAAAFGRTAGIRMVNMVRDGSAALEEMLTSAERLGLVLDEHLIRRAEEVNDKWTLMTGRLAIEFQDFVLRAVNGWAFLFDKFDEILDSRGGELASNWWDGFLNTMIPGSGLIGPMVEVFDRLMGDASEAGIESLEENMARLKTRRDAALGELAAIDEEVFGPVLASEMRAALDAEIATIDAYLIELEKRVASAQSIVDAGAGALAEAEVAPHSTTPVTPLDAPDPATEEQFKAALRKRAELAAAATKVFTETRTATEKYAAEIAELDELVKLGSISWGTYERAVDAAKLRLEEADQVGRALADGLSSAFDKFFSDGKFGWRDLAKVAVQSLADIGRAALTNAQPSASQGIGGVIVGGFKSLLGFQHGGKVAGGEPIIVGEAGEEIFVPHTDGVIVPNHLLKRGGSGALDGRDHAAPHAVDLDAPVGGVFGGFLGALAPPGAGLMAAIARSLGRFGVMGSPKGKPMGKLPGMDWAASEQVRDGWDNANADAAARNAIQDRIEIGGPLHAFGGDRPNSISNNTGSGFGGPATDPMGAGVDKSRSAPSRAFAAGGPIRAGTRATVGEIGPELFIPTAPRLAPSTGGGGGGRAPVTVVMNVDLSGASLEAAAILDNKTDELKREVLAAIQASAAQGGDFARMRQV
jgi:hypothetical protein